MPLKVIARAARAARTATPSGSAPASRRPTADSTRRSPASASGSPPPRSASACEVPLEALERLGELGVVSPRGRRLHALRRPHRRGDRPLPRRAATTSGSGSPSTTRRASSSRCGRWRSARSSCSRRRSSGAIEPDRAAELIEVGIDPLADLIAAMHSKLVAAELEGRRRSGLSSPGSPSSPASSLAALGAIGEASSEDRELSLGSLDPWLVVYALGLLVALGALPFVLHERMAARTEDRDRRWELALAAWGGIALLAARRVPPPRPRPGLRSRHGGGGAGDRRRCVASRHCVVRRGARAVGRCCVAARCSQSRRCRALYIDPPRMRAAALQLNSTGDVARNVETAERLVRARRRRRGRAGRAAREVEPAGVGRGDGRAGRAARRPGDPRRPRLGAGARHPPARRQRRRARRRAGTCSRTPPS